MTPTPASAPAAVPTRSCERCTVCCTVMRIDALDKPEGARCAHLRSHGRPGCATYASRPTECREWACLWLVGHGEESHRPDKSGILLCGGYFDPAGKRFSHVQMREAWPGAFTGNPLAEAYAKEIVKSQLLYLIEGDRRTLYGPPDLVREVESFLGVQVRSGGSHAI